MKARNMGKKGHSRIFFSAIFLSRIGPHFSPCGEKCGLCLYGDSSSRSFRGQFENATMRCTCPNCAEVSFQDYDADGLSYCPNCHKLFPRAKPMPPWILGVLTVLTVALMANWLMLLR